MVTITLFQNDVKIEFWEADEAARAIEQAIDAVLELVSERLISQRDAAARLDILYTELRKVTDGPCWEDFIPCDGAVMPPAKLADDGLPVYVWPTMHEEVS